MIQPTEKQPFTAPTKAVRMAMRLRTSFERLWLLLQILLPMALSSYSRIRLPLSIEQADSESLLEVVKSQISGGEEDGQPTGIYEEGW